MGNYNMNSGYGQALMNYVATEVPTFGRLFVCMNSSNTDEENYQRIQETFPTDPAGATRFFTSVATAEGVMESNNNDVCLLDANSTHVLATAWALSENRKHFIGMDGGDRLIQQGAKVANTDGTAAAYVLKNTGTRNSFRNIKFIQVDDDATSLTVGQSGGEGNLYKNCSFTFGVADNLDQTNAYEFVCGEDSGTFIDCMFGQATLLTSAARTVMAVDQVTASQEMKDCIFKDCQWWIASSSSDANLMRILANTDAKFNNVFIRPIMMNALVGSQSAAAVDDAVDSVSGLVEGSFLFVQPASNATEFCTGVTDQMEVVGPATDAATGEAITPA
jgi:hypothetical protein